MSQPARIEDDPRNPLLLGSVHAFYQGSLMVALKSLQASALALRYATEPLVDARKGFLPIDARLAGTQHVEIGAVNDQDSFGIRERAPNARPGLDIKEVWGRCQKLSSVRRSS